MGPGRAEENTMRKTDDTITEGAKLVNGRRQVGRELAEGEGLCVKLWESPVKLFEGCC